MSYNPNDVEHEYCGFCNKGPTERAMCGRVEEPVTRKIRVELEEYRGRYTLILSAPGIETVRHSFASEAEARAALQRGFDAIGNIAAVTSVDTTEAAQRFLGGESLQFLKP